MERLGKGRVEGREVDVAALIDARKLSGFNYRLIVLSCLITLFDGLDLMMVSFTAPYMRDELHLSKAMLGNLFAAGTAGQILGGFLFCYIADHVGRRPTIMVASFLFGLLTIATAFCQTFPELLVLRFTDGLAIGGMLPIAWALNIEFVPRRMRSTVVTLIMLGYSVGAAAAGPLTNLVAPQYGWQGVYIAGGTGTLVCAVALWLWLPESVRFLTGKGIKSDRVSAILRRMDPMADVAPIDRFTLGDEGAAGPRFHARDLFRGDLRLITPLLWLGYMASALAVYANGSWGPLLLEYLAVPRRDAALVAALGGLLGSLAGVTLMRASQGRGVRWVALYPALAVPALLLLGLGLAPHGLFLPLVVVSGLLVGGGHSAVISIAGIYYPSVIRANGSGWATSVAKIGGVAGPIMGAAVLASGMPVVRAYALLAICPMILCLAVLGIARVVGRLGIVQVSNREAAI